jgi:acyl-CoA thioesterase FadM
MTPRQIPEPHSAGTYLSHGAYSIQAPVRAYEPGANGRLGPGNLLRYCEVVANLASAASGFGPQWYLDRNEGWVIFRQTLELGAGIGPGGTLELMTWVQSFSRVSSLRCYRLTNAATGAIVARAATTWAYVDRTRQTPKRIPPEVLAEIPRNTALTPIPPRPQWPHDPAHALPATQVEWWARGYEADSLRHVNNCVYGDWLAEAARLAFTDWATIDPRFATPPLLRRMELHYQRSILPCERVTITTTPERIGPRGIVLTHAITPRDDPATPLLTATAWWLSTG